MTKFIVRSFLVSLTSTVLSFSFSIASLDTTVSNPANELANKIYQNVVELHKKINQTLDIFNYNIAYATVLLRECEEDLKKIVFEEAQGITDILPTEQAEALISIMEEDLFPEWVKYARMTSPTVKIKKMEQRSLGTCYVAFLLEKENEHFILQEGDHDVWIENSILHGYNLLGDYFYQQYTGGRVCGSD